MSGDQVGVRAAAAGSDDTDAVRSAARWLAEHGIEVPTAAPDRPGPDAADPHRASGPTADEDLDPKRRARDSRAGSDRRSGRGSDRARSRRAGPGTPVEGPGSDGLDDPVATAHGLDDPVATARGVVLRKLTAQARTRHELDRALKAKDIPTDVADQVLDRMEEVGLVDDAAFARDWVESRQQRRQLSRQALRHELQHKGVDRDEIEDALASVDGNDEYEAARALAVRKARSTAGLAREVRYRRLAGALARRGFSSGLTTRVLGEVLDGDQE